MPFFATEAPGCEHAFSGVTAAPAGALLTLQRKRATATVICAVGFTRISSLNEIPFWRAMLRCTTHICPKNMGKGTVSTQPGRRSTYFPALNSASCKSLECELGGDVVLGVFWGGSAARDRQNNRDSVTSRKVQTGGRWHRGSE